jgi:hypothetical protein
MKTKQAWGWLAAGVLALGLNGIYHDGGAEWVQRVAAPAFDRAEAVLALVSGRADQFVSKIHAETQLVAARHETQSCRLGTMMAGFQTKVARAQAGMARFEAMSAREQAQLARVEAGRARIEAEAARFRFDTVEFNPTGFEAPKIPVICPRVRIAVPHAPMARVRVREGAGSV